MDIRAYTGADRAGCLAVFDSNAMAEREEFAAFLDTGTMYVAEHDGSIVGCGGFTIHGESAQLHWGIVGRQWQRQGVGRFLLFFRLREITKDSNVEMVTLQAPRLAAPFFVSQGFRETASEGERVQMVKRLAVCA